MVEAKVNSSKRSRSASSSSESSKSGSLSDSSSGSSSSGSSSSSSSSSSRSRPSPRRRASRTRDDRRTATVRRSPRRNIRRSPRRSPRHTDQRSKDRGNGLSSRRTPSLSRRRVSPERRRRTRSRTPQTSRRAASPPASEPRRFSVRNLSKNLTKEHLAEIFGIYGTLKSCEMPADRIHPHLNRGYGYVEYEKADDAEKAMKHMDGGQVDGLEIQCELTIPYRSSANTRNRSPPLRDRNSSPSRKKLSPRRSPRRGVSQRNAGSPRGRASSPRRRSPRSITGANTIPLGRRSRSRSPRR